MKIFGLVGKNIDYSFSVNYFTQKFQNEGINDSIYKNFDIPDISYLPQIIKKNKGLKGLNVTIPYKTEVIPYLNKLSRKAEQIGAVNCIRLTKKGKLKGYNTDVYGFRKSLKPLLGGQHRKALILGAGGASKAVAFVLKELEIEYRYVSRNPQVGEFSYSDISKMVMQDFLVIINCTPIGTFPDSDSSPDLNYDYFSSKHIAFDLVYNPAETKFLQLAKAKGAVTKNGYDMLVFQAEKAWALWNK